MKRRVSLAFVLTAGLVAQVSLAFQAKPESAAQTKAQKHAARRARMSPTPLPPPGATAQCKDGTFTVAADPLTSCAEHRGVRVWLVQPPNRTAR
ncbi:MAG: hypothetical protein C5B57_12140 [Blastocatellia bacterium]|nr:MAG: hypothetical protein C5B57_12140 [Blastocatellia bacterium]